MDSRIKALLEKYHLKVVRVPIGRYGYLVNTPGKKHNSILINSRLSDRQVEQVILHEIGHHKEDNNVVGNYSVSYVTRVRCEHEANKYMISELIREHANLDYDVSRLNYVDLAESLGINNYLQVRQELSKYKVKK